MQVANGMAILPTNVRKGGDWEIFGLQGGGVVDKKEETFIFQEGGGWKPSGHYKLVCVSSLIEVRVDMCHLAHVVSFPIEFWPNLQYF